MMSTELVRLFPLKTILNKQNIIRHRSFILSNGKTVSGPQ